MQLQESGYYFTKERIERFFVFLCIVLLIYTWYVHACHVDLIAAMSGESPIDWLATRFHAASYHGSFPNFLSEYEVSFFMHIYLVLHKIGIGAATATQLVIGLNMVLIAAAYGFLCRVLVSDISLLLYLLVLLLVLNSNAISPDLGRWEAPTYYGLYYNFADACRLVAIAFWLRRAFIFSGIFLSLCSITHPTMALYAVVFILAIQLCRRKELFQWRMIVGGVIFVVVTMIWLRTHLHAGQLLGNKIPLSSWVSLNQLTSSHWFPFTLGVFGIFYAMPLLAFLCFIALLIQVYIKSGNFHYRHELAYGFIAIGILTILGFIFSLFPFSPLLIKLALQRSSGLILRIGIVIVAAYLWYQVEHNKNLLIKTFSLSSLILPFVSTMPYPLINTLLATYHGWSKGMRFKAHFKYKLILIYCCILLVLAIAYVLAGYGDGMGGMAPISLSSLSYIGGYLGWFVLLLSFLLLLWRKSFPKSIICRSLILLLFIIAGVKWATKQKMSASEVAFATHYKQVQLWAAKHTSPGAMFMVDPDIFYGWTAYSYRPFLGNVRFWLMTWIYTNNYAAYTAGLQLVKDFRINLSGFLTQNKINHAAAIDGLYAQARHNYYTLGDNWYCMMARKYGVKYAVLINQYVKGKSKFPVVYSGHLFSVMKIDQRLCNVTQN